LSRVIVAKDEPSGIVWSGISDTTGASLIALTVKAAWSEFASNPGSVAVNVIASDPNQSMSGIVIVAILEPSMETVSSVFPAYPQDISESKLSISSTYVLRSIVAKVDPSSIV